jgi:hypothetical protein
MALTSYYSRGRTISIILDEPFLGIATKTESNETSKRNGVTGER